MATVTPTTSRIGNAGRVVQWTGIVTGDTLTAFEIPETPGLMTVHFGGTFANGTSLGLNTSNVNDDYVTAEDLAGAAISGVLADAIYGVSTAGRWIQPTVASGSSDSTTVTVVYWVR